MDSLKMVESDDSFFEDASTSDVGSIFSDAASSSELADEEISPESSLSTVASLSPPKPQISATSSTPIKQEFPIVIKQKFEAADLGRGVQPTPLVELQSSITRRRINALLSSSEARKAKTPKRYEKENIPNSLSSIRSRFERKIKASKKVPN